jgi:hypothetical protein
MKSTVLKYRFLTPMKVSSIPSAVREFLRKTCRSIIRRQVFH